MLVNSVFIGMALLLAAIAAYWFVGRGAPRPAGSLAVCAQLGCLALAFLAYTPLLIHVADDVVPHLSRLMSNSASMGAATASVASFFQMNLDSGEANRRIRLRLNLVAALLAGMTGLFLWEGLMAPSSRAYALYLGLFISYLSLALVDFLRQALLQSRSTRRGSVRFGLRLAAAGCVFGLVYAAYKTPVLLSLALGLNLVHRDGPSCSSLVAPPCVFSVTAPALSVLFIGIGLTLPAAAYPISRAQRRRWEARSFVALEPLWRDLAAAMPHIVLRAPDDGGDMNHDPAFLLQRRVVEISDGLLALRPYRPQNVLDVAQQSVDADTRFGAAFVEAAVTRAALTGLRSGLRPEDAVDDVTSYAFPRGGDLRAEADWLVAVAGAYTNGDTPNADAYGRPEPIGA